jgi:hypothetical protein
MTITEYKKNYVYDPLIPYIWILLDKLPKANPKYRSSIHPKKLQNK